MRKSLHTFQSPPATTKATFLELAKVVPRPLTKKIRFEGTTYEDYTLEGDGFVLGIPRSALCVIVEPARPARYECPSILSEAEEAALGAF